jgi:hypothetical protein
MNEAIYNVLLFSEGLLCYMDKMEDTETTSGLKLDIKLDFLSLVVILLCNPRVKILTISAK